MRDWYRSISVRTALIFILLDVLIVGFFSAVLYRHFSRMTRESVEQSLEATIAANDNKIRELLNRIEITTELVHDSNRIYRDTDTELPEFLDMIVSFQEREDNSQLVAFLGDYKRNRNLFLNYFKTCFGEMESLYSTVFFVDESWPVHRYLRKPSDCVSESGFGSSVRVKEEEWYQRAREYAGEPYWFILEGREPVICMAVQLKYRHIVSAMESTEEELGVLVVTFDSSLLSGYLELNGLTRDSEIFLLDGADTVIYSTNARKRGETVHEPASAARQGQNEWQYEGKLCLLRQSQLPLGLSVVTVVPVSEVRDLAAQGMRIILLAGVATLAAGVFFTIVLSMIVLTPLKEFAVYMEAGDTAEFPFDEGRRDEIGRLYRSFRQLMKQLKESMLREKETQEHKAQAELRALQAQINPHFIYNTLNSISCLAMLNGQEHIADLISNMTKVVRYNLSDPLALVAVEEEVRIIRQYEHIQKNCYRDRLCFSYDIAPETLDVMIPKLVIQPLVENAIFHSRNTEEKTIRILLKITAEDHVLCIRVVDHGREADIGRINQYACGQRESATKSLGVRNIYERLQIVYGGKAGMCYQKDAAGNTEAVIRIPV